MLLYESNESSCQCTWGSLRPCHVRLTTQPHCQGLLPLSLRQGSGAPQHGYSNPSILKLHPYANISKLKLSAQFTTYATNPWWITKLNIKFFLPIYFLLLLLLDSRFSWKERDICLKKFTLGRKEVEHMAFPAMSQGSVKNHTGEKRSVSAVLWEAEHAFAAQTKVKLRMWCGMVFSWTDNFWLVKVWMLWMDFICHLDVTHVDLQLKWYCNTITHCTTPKVHKM